MTESQLGDCAIVLITLLRQDFISLCMKLVPGWEIGVLEWVEKSAELLHRYNDDFK